MHDAAPKTEAALLAELVEYRDNLVKWGHKPTGAWHRLLDMVIARDVQIARMRFWSKSRRWLARCTTQVSP
jgi:hypothetical protein